MITRRILLSSRIHTNNSFILSKVYCSSRMFSSSVSDNGPIASENPSSPMITVWWDSSCPLCLREMTLMKKWSPPETIAFIDIASPSSTCPIDRQIMLTRFHVQEQGGEIVNGAQAFALLWKHIPRMQRLGIYLSSSPKALNIFERLYSTFFLPYLRPTFQKIFKLFGLEGRKSK